MLLKGRKKNEAHEGKSSSTSPSSGVKFSTNPSSGVKKISKSMTWR